MTFILRALLVGGFLLTVGASPVSASGDLNCSDFGTRERAQREFLKSAIDIHQLDADNDGKPCEWNESTGWWVWPIAGAALVGGRVMARRRIGDYRMVPGVQSVVFNYQFSEDGQADKVPDRVTAFLMIAGVIGLPITTVLRDYIFPKSSTPIAFYVAVVIVCGAASYFAALKISRRDLYVVESAPKDEGEL